MEMVLKMKKMRRRKEEGVGIGVEWRCLMMWVLKRRVWRIWGCL